MKPVILFFLLLAVTEASILDPLRLGKLEEKNWEGLWVERTIDTNEKRVLSEQEIQMHLHAKQTSAFPSSVSWRKDQSMAFDASPRDTRYYSELFQAPPPFWASNGEAGAASQKAAGATSRQGGGNGKEKCFCCSASCTPCCPTGGCCWLSGFPQCGYLCGATCCSQNCCDAYLCCPGACSFQAGACCSSQNTMCGSYCCPGTSQCCISGRGNATTYTCCQGACVNGVCRSQSGGGNGGNGGNGGGGDGDGDGWIWGLSSGATVLFLVVVVFLYVAQRQRRMQEQQRRQESAPLLGPSPPPGQYFPPSYPAYSAPPLAAATGATAAAPVALNNPPVNTASRPASTATSTNADRYFADYVPALPSVPSASPLLIQDQPVADFYEAGSAVPRRGDVVLERA